MILMTFKKEINIFCQSFPDQSQKSSFFVTIFRWSASFDWSWWVLSWMHWKVRFVLIKGSVENWAVKGDVDGAKEERKKKGRAIHNVKDGCGTCETWKRNGRDSINSRNLSVFSFIFTWIDSTLSFPITLRRNFPHQAFLSWQLMNSKKNWTCRHCCWDEHHKKWGVYFNLWIQKPEGNLQRGNRISQSLGPLGLGLLNKFFRGFPLGLTEVMVFWLRVLHGGMGW